MFKCKYALATLILNCFLFINTNAYLVLNFKLPTTRYGFVYPNRGEPNSNITYVHEGVDVLINLAKVPKNYDACKITTPDTEFTYTLTPGAVENDIVEFWSPNSNSNECGARIKNVNVTNSGRWRLQAINTEENYRIQSFINLQVIKNFDRQNENFDVRKNESNELNITYLANYCQISNPHLPGEHNIYDNCLVDLENINRLYGGKWKVSVGIYGKIDEIPLEPKVNVLEETFDVGTNKTGSKINLFCNLKDAPNTTEISFCRFVKSGQDIGLRLNEGLSNGKYSYYGRKLKDGDCGVTIENPETSDYVAWKCAIGLYRNKGDKKLQKFEVKESVISLVSSKRRKGRSLDYATAKIDQNEEFIEDILGGIGNPLTISYEADFRIKYCVIKHPDGRLFSINGPYENEEWFSKGDLNIGVCKMTLNNVSKNETGIWQIQIGHYDVKELDEIKKVRVRIGDNAIVAVVQNIETSLDSRITLKCISVSEIKVLEYCRFSLPNDGKGFQINEQINTSNAIDGLYWYKQTNGESVNNGICQVTIKKVNAAHFGKWTCAAKLMDSEKPEDVDYIYVVSSDDDGLTIASISGIVVGAALAIMLVGTIFVCYRRKGRQIPQPQRRQTYLSSTSRSSAEITHFERIDPLVSVEGERQPTEEIEMTQEQVSSGGEILTAHSEPEHRRESSGSAQEHRRETTASQPQSESRRQISRSDPEEIISSF